jgi:hypothetical protein
MAGERLILEADGHLFLDGLQRVMLSDPSALPCTIVDCCQHCQQAGQPTPPYWELGTTGLAMCPNCLYHNVYYPPPTNKTSFGITYEADGLNGSWLAAPYAAPPACGWRVTAASLQISATIYTKDPPLGERPACDIAFKTYSLSAPKISLELFWDSGGLIWIIRLQGGAPSDVYSIGTRGTRVPDPSRPCSEELVDSVYMSTAPCTEEPGTVFFMNSGYMWAKPYWGDPTLWTPSAPPPPPGVAEDGMDGNPLLIDGAKLMRRMQTDAAALQGRPDPCRQR